MNHGWLCSVFRGSRCVRDWTSPTRKGGRDRSEKTRGSGSPTVVTVVVPESRGVPSKSRSVFNLQDKLGSLSQNPGRWLDPTSGLTVRVSFCLCPIPGSSSRPEKMKGWFRRRVVASPKGSRVGIPHYGRCTHIVNRWTIRETVLTRVT